MPQQLYTPFFAQATQNVGNALLARGQQQKNEQTNALFGQAYLGDQQALQELAQVNPQLAQQAQQGIRQRQADEAARAGAQQNIQREIAEEAKDIATEAAKMPDLEAANAFVEREKERLRPVYGDAVDNYTPFSPEEFEQTKAALAQSPEQQELDIKRGALDIKKETLDIKREDAALKRDQQQLDRETDALKRKDLQSKIDARKAKIDAEKEKISDAAQQAIVAVDSSIASIDRLLEHKGLAAAVGTSSVIPSLPGSDAASFEAHLEAFDAQIFSQAIKQMVGMGSLSDAEGKKISSSVGAINIKMSEDEFKKSLKTIRDGFELSKKRLKAKGYKADEAAQGGEVSIDDLVNKYAK